MHNENPLFQKALLARQNAYAPYSGFLVGAALETADGACFLGCNIESASYCMTICAERTALFSAVAAGQRHFRAIAIVGGSTDEAAGKTPCLPCGACLQVLSEFCPPDFIIYLSDGAHSLGELFPKAFCLE